MRLVVRRVGCHTFGTRDLSMLGWRGGSTYGQGEQGEQCEQGAMRHGAMMSKVSNGEQGDLFISSHNKLAMP